MCVCVCVCVWAGGGAVAGKASEAGDSARTTARILSGKEASGTSQDAAGPVTDHPQWRSHLHNLHVDINPVDMVFMESRVIAARQDTNYSTPMHLVADMHNAVASECNGISLQGILNLVDNRSTHGGEVWSDPDTEHGCSPSVVRSPINGATDVAVVNNSNRSSSSSSSRSAQSTCHAVVDASPKDASSHGDASPPPGTAAEDGGFVCVPGFHKVFAEWVVATQLGAASCGGFGREFLGGAALSSSRAFGVGRARGRHGRRTPAARSSVFWFSGTPLGDAVTPFAQRVSARAGSMIIFDSRLPHGSRPNHSDRIRAAQFITCVCPPVFPCWCCCCCCCCCCCFLLLLLFFVLWWWGRSKTCALLPCLVATGS